VNCRTSLDPSATGEEASPLRSVIGGFRTDSLAEGVVLLMALTVVQRIVGFVREVLFCRSLPPDELGQWSLSYGFLLLAAPLLVLSLPGTFGRYVEHYRQRGQLRPFLRRTTLASAALALLGVAALWIARRQVSWFVFSDQAHAELVVLLAASLLAVIAFNFLFELLTALRRTRIASGMQLVNSLSFALIGLGLLYWWGSAVASVIVAYAAACLLTSLGAIYFLRRVWRTLPPADAPLAGRNIWPKLLRFSAWIWVADTLANLFGRADCYMIMHFGTFGQRVAETMVGNYHSARVVPMLMVAVAAMFSAIVLPHLSHDWEHGRRGAVSDRLNLALKLAGLMMTGAGVAVLLGSPVLFGWALGGKYDGGLAVLPWTLAYCVWFALSVIAQNYLLCSERVDLASCSYLAGLILNVALNVVLLPRLGLPGAVLATAAANAVALALVCILSRWLGMKVHTAMWLIGLMPLSLCLGPWPAAGAWIVFTWSAIRTDWIFTGRERRQLTDAAAEYVSKFRRLAAHKIPASA